MLGDAAVTGPEVALLVGALVTLLGGSFTPRTRQWRMRAVAGLAATAALVLAVVGLAGGRRQAFEGTFVADDVTGVARVVVCAAVLLVLLAGGDEIAGEPRESEICTMVLLGAVGTLLLAGGTDLALLVVAFLLSSIPLYGLVGVLLRDGAAEAALKTYLLAALLGIVLMLGAVLLAGVTGATDYASVGPALAGAPPAVVAAGAVMVLGGLLFKVGAVPGHFWVPDAAQGASVTAAAFVTTVPKVGGLVALARLVELLPHEARWSLLVAVLATASMTLGNLAAFAQDDPRRLLGWSTVSQVGYLLVPVAALGRSDLAVPALLFYLAAYAVTNVGAFAVVAAVPGADTLTGYRRLAAGHPALGGALAVLLLGLLGTPPTAVFVGKLVAATAAWDGGLEWLSVALVVNTLASLFYYLRWLAPVFGVDGASRDDPGSADQGRAVARRPAVAALAAAVVAAVVSLLLGLAAGAAWPLLDGATLG